MNSPTNKASTLQFLGATGTVTGSKFLLASGEYNLLVDCGLYQGFKQYRLRNRAPLPVSPGRINSILLTHAHLDHSGYLPIIVKNGFKGPIYCTPATAKLVEIILKDAAYLQEEEASYLNEHHLSKHSPPLPLFNLEDVTQVMGLIQTHDFDTPMQLSKDVSFQFLSAGHILGSAFIHIQCAARSLLFSGDVGRPTDILVEKRDLPLPADYVVMESTYGDRRHLNQDVKELIKAIVHRTVNRKGTILIPSFAVARAQKILFLLCQLKKAGSIPKVPIYLNSPMASNVNDVYKSYGKRIGLADTELKLLMESFQSVDTVEESRHLNSDKTPKIIIAGSGMATGGRIIHHLKYYAPHPQHTVFFVGFQAPGTRGDAIVGGAPAVKIHGEMVPIHCEVVHTDSLSSHADGQELIEWIAQPNNKPRRIFLVHGELSASDQLRMQIEQQLKWNVCCPELGEVVSID